jgi:hypothetical protein
MSRKIKRWSESLREIPLIKRSNIFGIDFGPEHKRAVTHRQDVAAAAEEMQKKGKRS